MENLELITKIKVYSLEESNPEIKKLIETAKKATETAYAPYSNFHVGAAALLANGEIVTGNNQENAAYPSGLCAERVAVFHANSYYPEVAVMAIAVAASNGKNFTEFPCSPCGSCRQVLLEVEERYKQPIKILLYGDKQVYELGSIKDILPLSFGQDALANK